jgi:hypothetical protein
VLFCEQALTRTTPCDIQPAAKEELGECCRQYAEQIKDTRHPGLKRGDTLAIRCVITAVLIFGSPLRESLNQAQAN